MTQNTINIQGPDGAAVTLTLGEGVLDVRLAHVGMEWTTRLVYGEVGAVGAVGSVVVPGPRAARGRPRGKRRPLTLDQATGVDN